MKWKHNIVIKKGDDYQIQIGNLIHPVPKKDTYLLDAMERGVTEDAALIHLIMQTECIDETAAAFGLAQFMLDYSDFIAPDTSHYVITN